MIIFKNIRELVTPVGDFPVRGGQMNHVRVIKNAEIVVNNGVIEYVGKAKGSERGEIDRQNAGSGDYAADSAAPLCENPCKDSCNSSQSDYKAGDGDTIIDCGGNAVVPGFVDSHTHLVFGGDRADEFMWRQSGVSYMDIMARGGGIMSSVLATREASEEELYKDGLNRLDELVSGGVTTAEIKSGYGLDLETELKQLRVIDRLKRESKIDIAATFMGAHAIPPKYKGKNAEYISYIIKNLLPEVKKQNLAEFVDIFCEQGVFSAGEAENLLTAFKKAGFKTKIHADEIVSTGGAELAARLGCISADHLLHASEKGITALADSGTIATLLPLTAFCLKEPYADARKLIGAGAAVALATDFNPGSCFSSSIALLIAISVIYMRMTLAEVITALTLNAACALDLGKTHGSLEAGKVADIVILKYPSVNFLAYHTGVNCVDRVYKKGNLICHNS